MIPRLFLFSIALYFAIPLAAQDPLLVNAYHRASTSLDGDWNYIVDPYENGFYNYRYEPFENQKYPGKAAFFLNSKPADKTDLVEYNFDNSGTLQVPGDWNTQGEDLFYYEGTVWYKRSFDYSPAQKENRVFVYFGAVNYRADVYLNGTKLGTHLGGFTPFNFEVSSILKAKDNFLVLKVDNKRHRSAVPTLNTDWWNYGGITRSVKLLEVPPSYIQDYQVQLDPENHQQIQGYVQLAGPDRAGTPIQLRIPELKETLDLKSDAQGRATFALQVRKLKLWSPKQPYLYRVEISAGKDNLRDKIGFRSIATQGPDILLNGEKLFLKGICLHEEAPFGKGRRVDVGAAKTLLSWAQQLGCNYIRLAHYPHNETIVRLADEMGILLWKEIPVYWTIDWENPETYRNAEQQLSEMIARDKNRAAVIIWSMANETPVKPARTAFLTQLASRARQLDGTRLISAALEQSDYQGDPFTRTIHDPFAEVVDVLSFNQYIGWYDGLPDKCDRINWTITQNKPVLISEFGAGAKYGMRGDSLTRWSEDYQAHLYRQTLKMISRIDNLSGFSPWVLVDFRSPRRPLPGIQDGWNRKGLVSEQGEFKAAFEVLRRYYEGLEE